MAKQRDTIEMMWKANLPILHRWKWRFRDLALLGAALWLITTPLVMSHFHIFSPIALVLNVGCGSP